jgi:hypothetical protein
MLNWIYKHRIKKLQREISSLISRKIALEDLISNVKVTGGKVNGGVIKDLLNTNEKLGYKYKHLKQLKEALNGTS